jgi:hypothetical protein
MQKVKVIFRSDGFILPALLLIIAGLVYLPFISQIGYFNDDWYLMYAAGAKGAAVFKDIFIVDRPMRALVMMPAYTLLGNNPVLYNLSALGFKLLSATFFFLFLSILWPGQKRTAWLIALLYLIYPGFLSQFNGIDYQSQMVGLAGMMLTLVLTVYAYRSKSLPVRLALFILLTMLTAFYLGLVEYFIGMEALKLAAILLLIFRDNMDWLARAKRSIAWFSYSLLTVFPFLAWRLFFFESERGATDVNIKMDSILSDPLAALLGWSSTLAGDIADVSFRAWIEPLQRTSPGTTPQEWVVGSAVAALVLVLTWQAIKDQSASSESKTQFAWRIEALWLGIVMLIFGLLPVILAGRYVDFKSFSRYALAPSIGAVLLWPAVLAFIPNRLIGKFITALLIVSSVLTHYGNGLARVHETEAIQNFWWQVSWRIPQMETGTTLVANYPVTAEEDYFIWGPANIIYHPESAHKDYAQPAIYAALLNNETIASVQAREPQEFSNRRGIRTYKNYRNILILSQPTSASCVQVIDGKQVELSTVEDERVKAVASFSEVEHILTAEPFRTPPTIPFGAEPAHGWCYFYEKASFARQVEDWEEAARLGDEALALGLSAGDPIEWMPFLQAYAMLDDSARIDEIAPFLTSDLTTSQQACQTLTAMPLSAGMMEQMNKLFCDR